MSSSNFINELGKLRIGLLIRLVLVIGALSFASSTTLKLKGTLEYELGVDASVEATCTESKSDAPDGR